MRNVYEIMKEREIKLPAAPAKGGIYTPVQRFGDNLLYCSGCGPNLGDGNTVTGKIGRDLSLEDGQRAAYQCMLNLLANLEQEIGDLNKIKRFVKVLAFVNCVDSYEQQPLVVNGGSRLLADLFGDDAGVPARSAIGTNALPGNIACEIEVLVELKEN